ncbi:hypothetical protein [Arthrobacter koreensis]|uniref:hypothetical protein n=1 Tax=Arthrobacter koreensis TaxID=199136 RepID=UPI002DB8DD25|nr:hypothetical protein [Arthrobacter koreensis]MEB7448232.1 hypothetical protein [Arthrobacter koreensis]
MIPAIIGWVLPLVLLLSCSWVAASAWTSSGPAAARSRRRLLAALLETASVAVFMRLVVEWSPVTIWLWVLSVAALAAGAAGTVIRWDSLPRTASVADSASGAGPAAARAESTRGRRGGQSREPGTITLGSYALVLAAAVAVSAAIG